VRVPAARIVFGDADREEILGRIDTALRSGSLTLGQNTRELEAEFARGHHTPHAIAVASGTAALEIALRAVGVAGHDVVVPTNTFAATAYAVLAAGGRPVFADIDAATLSVSAETVSAALTPRTRAVVVVHIGGLISPEMDAVARLCTDAGLTLVEDAAHAHGSTLDGRYAGSWGAAATFSFYPTKVITSGEGGLIATADDRIRDEALMMRDQGKAGFLGNEHVRFGYAWRMSELHAAVGLVHLRRLPDFVAARRRSAARYDAGLAGIAGVAPLPAAPGSVSNYYKYIAVLDEGADRAAVKRRLADSFDVFLSGEVYDTPLHRQPVFAELAGPPLPVAERLCARHICLPLHSDLTDAEADHVLAALAEVLGR
jgi:dTDP-4-amino-4,6-dideoxygalactose transaminase